MLKVSFFRPFYSGYNVIASDNNYKNVLVAGGCFNYLWILSCETSVTENIKTEYLKIAADYGFLISDLLWIEQDK